MTNDERAEKIARFLSTPEGKKAIREPIEALLKEQGHWDRLIFERKIILPPEIEEIEGTVTVELPDGQLDD